MALPLEIQEKLRRSRDVQVSLKTSEGEKAIIEGKTPIAFGSFVKLVLKRKVQLLFKDWQEEPVIISSELLTKIASAPEDTHEDRSKVILTALVLGLCFGLFCSLVTLILLNMAGIQIGQRELLAGLSVLLVLALAVYAALRVQTWKWKQEMVEKVEKMADLFSK